MDFLKDDPTLTEKMTIDQLEGIKSGVDDSSLEEAYEGYKRVLAKNPEITPKGIMDFLKDDPMLTEKMTIDQLEGIKSDVDDSSLEEAYQAYKEVINGIEDKPYTLNREKKYESV